MARNLRNYGLLEGRLTRDPMVFTNKDGSKKVMLNVAVQDNYKGKDGKKGSQFIQLEAFVSNKTNGIGVFGYMHKGDMVGFGFTVRTNNYVDKEGKQVYGQVLLVTEVDLKESKATTDARLAKNAAAGQAPAPAAAPATAEPAPVAAAPYDPSELPFG